MEGGKEGGGKGGRKGREIEMCSCMYTQSHLKI